MQASFLHFVLKKKLRKIRALVCWGKHADGRENTRVWVAIFTRARVLNGLGSSSSWSATRGTEALCSQRSGGTTTSHNFFSVSRSDGFLADRDLWKVLCQFICMENSTIYYTVTSLGQSFGGLFSLVEPGCLQYVLLWILSQLNYSHSV